MKRTFLSLALVALAFAAMSEPGIVRDAGAQTQSLTAAAQRTLARKYDVLNVKGEFLRAFHGTPIENLSVLALKNGTLAPIPFQIDERNRKGLYVMKFGKTASKDEDNGALDGNDELLLAVADMGDRLPDADRAARIEIDVIDPRYPDKHAWAYLAAYPAKAPRSTMDYVNYDQPAERIVSKNYILGYRKGYMFYNDLIYPTSSGGNGQDFFDRIKFRTRIEFLGGKVVVVRNEDMVKAEVQGWIDGPIRVVQSTINYAKLFDTLPPVSFNSSSEYYPYIQTSPITVKFPLDLNTTIKILGIKTITADVYGDMPGMVGGNSYTNLDSKGYTYTGKATPDILGKIPKLGLVWGFASKKGVGTWFPRLIFPDALYQYNKFYVNDNDTTGNPPDDVTGEIGAGVRFDFTVYPPELHEMMSKDSFMLKFETYFAPPGLTSDGAREWLDIQDYPILVDVRAGKSAPAPKSLVANPTSPPWKGGVNGSITDVRDRKVQLKGIAYFIGGVEVDPRTYFPGERVQDKTYHLCPLNKVKCITNYVVDYDPNTKTSMGMFSKVSMANGQNLDLLGCRSCGWAGLDDEGKVIYFSNAQIKRIDFGQ